MGRQDPPIGQDARDDGNVVYAFGQIGVKADATETALRRLPHRRLIDLLFLPLLARHRMTYSDIVGRADRHLLGSRRPADRNLIRLLSRGFRRCRRLVRRGGTDVFTCKVALREGDFDAVLAQ